MQAIDIIDEMARFLGSRSAPIVTPAKPRFSQCIQWVVLTRRGVTVRRLFTVLGVALGLGLVAQAKAVRAPCWAITQFFRNAPWLTLLFFMIYLPPYHMRIGGLHISLPDWLKAVIGLGLPVMANVAEIVRGGVRSIHPGQWEAAESLGFIRRQQLFSIILPQAFKRMLPPWMNLYAILTTNTTLASIVGVNDVVTRAGQALTAAGNNPGLLTPIYAYALLDQVHKAARTLARASRH